MPLVSVLIPAWDRGQYLGAAIESVLRQTWRDFEIVVADDGSSDGTAELVQQYEGVRYVWQPHSGIPAARNLALEHARGEVIAWLDSDDLYAPAKLEKQMARLLAEPSCQIVFCLLSSFSAVPYRQMNPRQRAAMEQNAQEYSTCLATACIRRSLFERYGGFDPRYNWGEDVEWLVRLRAAGVDLGYCVRERLYRRRVHDGQISYAHGRVSRRELLSIYADAIRTARKREGSPC